MSALDRIREVGRKIFYPTTKYAPGSIKVKAKVLEARNSVGRSLSYKYKKRDLSITKYRKVQKEVWRLWCTSPLAEQYVQLVTNHILGEGLVIKFENSKKAQKLVDEFWFDTRNKFGCRFLKGSKGDLGPRVFSLAQEYFLYGEQYVLHFQNEHAKYPIVSQVDPILVEHVLTDPENVQDEILYVLKADTNNKSKAYLALRKTKEDLKKLVDSHGNILGMDSAVPKRLKDLNIVKDVPCLHHSYNKVSNQTRGRSILTTKIDWIDAVENTYYDIIRRVQLLSAFSWDVTIDGGTDKEIESKLLEIREHPPKPGSVRVHNERETWSAITPNLTESSVQKDVRLLKLHVIQGFPEHWFAEGGNANRATAMAMGDPAVKMLKALQQQFVWMIAEIITYVIERAIEKGFLPAMKSDLKKYEFGIQTPDIAAQDNKVIAEAVEKISKSIAILHPMGIITDEDAVFMVSRALGEEVTLRPGGPPVVKDEEKEVGKIGDAKSKSKEKDDDDAEGD